jgi:ABC-type polar amino acid transport system ATPase subunit
VTSAQVMELLGELHAGGMTVVIVTHDAAVAQHASRRIVFKDGRVASDSIASDGIAPDSIAPASIALDGAAPVSPPPLFLGQA